MKERPLTHFALLSVAAAVVTFLLKLLAWRLTGSVGLLSDALESLANLAAALIALGSLAVAARPEDEDHAFGHSKAEYFAAGIEGGLIVVAAVAIGWTAVESFLLPYALTHATAGLAVSVVASGINLMVARVLARVGREHRSIALEADARHLMTDVWTSAVVIAAVGLVAVTGWWWLDPLLGLVLAFHIIAIGVKLIRESMEGLMDSSLQAEDQGAIRTALGRFAGEGVQYHALRTRRAAALKFVSVHLLMPGEWSIAKGHDVTERIEAELRDTVPGLIVFTHMEPVEDPASWQDVALERKPRAPKPGAGGPFY